MERLEPRDPDAAARAASAFALVGAGSTVVAAIISPAVLGDGLGRVLCVLTLAGLCTLGLVTLLRPRLLPQLVWVLMPTIVVVVIAFLDLISRDATAAGQIYLCWPVLFASHQLRRPAAILVLVEVITAEAVIVLTLLPLQSALSDLVSVSATLAVMTLLLVFMRDHEERLITRLHRLAMVDDLTGLHTRREFDRAAEVLLAAGTPFSLVLVDIDRFKLINDAHGHPVGDDVLVRTANQLRSSFRAGALVARLGGDEFAVLLPGCSYAVARERAAELAGDLAGGQHPGHDERRTGLPTARTIALAVSIGVAAAPDHAQTLRALYVAADQAMYQAKHAGGGRIGDATPATGTSAALHVQAPAF